MIRSYNSGDLEAMCELMKDLGYPTEPEHMKQRMERMEQSSTYHTFIAEQDGKAVGMIGVRLLHSYELDEVAVQISALVTRKQLQGQGIGTALIRHVEQWAAEQSASLIVLTSGIKEERQQAHQFYKSLGFQITGYRFVKKL